MKYRIIIKKSQMSYIEREFSGDQTLEEALMEIEKLSDEEMEFGEPEYHLDSIIKISGKIKKIVYQQGAWF